MPFIFDTWDELEARRRPHVGLLPYPVLLVPIGFDLAAAAIVAQSAEKPQEQPAGAQSGALDAIRTHERSTQIARKSGGESMDTEFLRCAIAALPKDAEFLSVLRGVEAAIRADIDGRRSVFFAETEDAFLFHYLNGKTGKLVKRDLPRRMRRRLKQEQRAA